MIPLFLLGFFSLLVPDAASLDHYCRKSEDCWPTDAELNDLNFSLTPNATRSLSWSRALDQKPYPCSVPYGSTNNQPLYGAGKELSALYVQSDDDRSGSCFVDNFTPTYCLIATRNNPVNGWEPAFIVWPTTTAHVQVAVKFAVDHNLCISVAGTGHDFLNRHSCDQGLFIRTALLKDIDWDLENTLKLGEDAEGTVRFGSGITFSEAHKSASLNGRSIASGWSITVGMAGWSMGGGHGPQSPKLGLGVDNLMQVEVVLADGSIATSNAKGTKIVSLDGKVTQSVDSDLLWAIRGGGGSAFGIVTAYTVRAHPVAEGGYAYATFSVNGEMCTDEGKSTFFAFIDAYLEWALQLDSSWGGLAFITPAYNSNATDGACAHTWSWTLAYLYQGSNSEEAFSTRWSSLLDKAPVGTKARVNSYKDVWSVFKDNQEDIYPVYWLTASSTYPGGIPSVLVSRDIVKQGRLTARLQKAVNDCMELKLCAQAQIYQDITGNIGSPQVGSDSVSISHGMRSSIFHVVVTAFTPADFTAGPDSWYSLGNNSYFSESAYVLPQWQERTWGAETYKRLLAVKHAVDPTGVFWCRHCVGDTSPE